MSKWGRRRTQNKIPQPLPATPALPGPPSGPPPEKTLPSETPTADSQYYTPPEKMERPEAVAANSLDDTRADMVDFLRLCRLCPQKNDAEGSGGSEPVPPFVRNITDGLAMPGHHSQSSSSSVPGTELVSRESSQIACSGIPPATFAEIGDSSCAAAEQIFPELYMITMRTVHQMRRQRISKFHFTGICLETRESLDFEAAMEWTSDHSESAPEILDDPEANLPPTQRVTAGILG